MALPLSFIPNLLQDVPLELRKNEEVTQTIKDLPKTLEGIPRIILCLTNQRYQMSAGRLLAHIERVVYEITKRMILSYQFGFKLNNIDAVAILSFNEFLRMLISQGNRFSAVMREILKEPDHVLTLFSSLMK